MKYEYCKECNTRECEYIEVRKFVEFINEKHNANYQLDKCPDKTQEGYTCDLVFKDDLSNNVIYIEVKRVKFGFGCVKKSSVLLGQQAGQNKCACIIAETISTLNESKINFLNNYMVSIPYIRLSDKDSYDFKDKIKDFFGKMLMDKKYESFSYVYKNGKNEINIVFELKNDEITRKFGNETLFMYDTEEDNILSSIFERMTDYNLLISLLEKNFEATSSKKFPQDATSKILLNILELPTGYETFFNARLGYIFEKLKEMKKENVIETAASEGYLLYYNDVFYLTDISNKSVLRYEDVLFIIPLIGEMISEKIVYTPELGGVEI